MWKRSGAGRSKTMDAGGNTGVSVMPGLRRDRPSLPLPGIWKKSGYVERKRLVVELLSRRRCSILSRSSWCWRLSRCRRRFGHRSRIHDTLGRFFKGKIPQRQRGEHENDHQYTGSLVQEIGGAGGTEQGLTACPSEYSTDIGTLARLQEYGNDQQYRNGDMNC